MIRKYRENDLEAIMVIWRRASELAHPFLTAEFLAQEAEAIREIHMPKANAWVYEADGMVMGFISLIGNEVGALFVDPAKARTGIGRALMDVAAEMHPMLEVDVFAPNGIGRAFYEHYGFVEIGRSIHAASGQELLRLRYG